MKKLWLLGAGALVVGGFALSPLAHAEPSAACAGGPGGVITPLGTPGGTNGSISVCVTQGPVQGSVTAAGDATGPSGYIVADGNSTNPGALSGYIGIETGDRDNTCGSNGTTDCGNGDAPIESVGNSSGDYDPSNNCGSDAPHTATGLATFVENGGNSGPSTCLNGK